MTSSSPTSSEVWANFVPFKGCRFNIFDISNIYVACPGMYDGLLEDAGNEIFFLRQGDPTNPEQWSLTGSSTININKQAMSHRAMGKAFWMNPDNAGNSLVQYPNKEGPDPSIGWRGAPAGRYRVQWDTLWISDISRDDGPLYGQDIEIEQKYLSYEFYSGAFFGEKLRTISYESGDSDVIVTDSVPWREIGYLFWRYNDGDPWTQINLGVDILEKELFCCSATEEDPNSFVPAYSYSITNDSANWPDSNQPVQFCAFDASQFTRLGDYVSQTYPSLNPQKITISQINTDGSWRNFTPTSIVDNGSYYSITLDTSDLLGDLSTKFNPRNVHTYRYKAYDTSGDPAGAVGTPEGCYTVRDGKFCVSNVDKDKRLWESHIWGQNRHESIWYWKYIDHPINGEWTQHTQTTGVVRKGWDEEANDYQDGYGASIYVTQFEQSNVIYPYLNDSPGEGYTVHFEATDQPANFPDGTRSIALTSHPRVTSRLFVSFDSTMDYVPRLVVEETAKQEREGSFYTKGTYTPPSQLVGVSDPQTGEITWTSQDPIREGQVLTFINPTTQGFGAMYISVEVSAGVFEWKPKV